MVFYSRLQAVQLLRMKPWAHNTKAEGIKYVALTLAANAQRQVKTRSATCEKDN